MFISKSAYQSILAQLLFRHRHEQNIIDKFSFAINHVSHGQLKATSLELIDLLQLCLLHHKDAYIVLDAIDECDNNKSLTQHLLRLSAKSVIKILLFSQLTIPILVRKVPKKIQLAINRASTSGDIRIYLTKQINILIKDKLLPHTAEPSRLVNHLIQGTDGMFLWARLIIAYLNLTSLTQA